MEIKMRHTSQGSPNGIQIVSYAKGEIYIVGKTITKELADVFVTNKLAIVEVENEVAEKPKQVDEQGDEAKAEKKKRLAAEKKAADEALKKEQAMDKPPENKGA